MKHLIAGLWLGVASLAAQAADSAPGPITIEQAYARATLAGQVNGAAYFTLKNHGADDRLLAASSAASTRVELHQMSLSGGVMRMREIDAIELPAGKTVELKPGGLHIMLMGLKAPIKAGADVQLILKFEKAGEMTVQVPVREGGAASMH